MHPITITVIVVLALAAGLIRADRATYRGTSMGRAAAQGAAVTVGTAALTLAALYTAAIAAGIGAVVFLLLAVRALDRGRVFTAVACAVALFLCLTVTALVGR